MDLITEHWPSAKNCCSTASQKSLNLHGHSWTGLSDPGNSTTASHFHRLLHSRVSYWRPVPSICFLCTICVPLNTYATYKGLSYCLPLRVVYDLVQVALISWRTESTQESSEFCLHPLYSLENLFCRGLWSTRSWQNCEDSGHAHLPLSLSRSSYILYTSSFLIQTASVFIKSYIFCSL